MQAIIAVLTGLGFLGAILIYGILTSGYICLKFWHWFILPIFPSLPDLNIWQCIGLMFFIVLFKNSNSNNIENKEKADYGKIVGSLITPWITLLMGYLFYLFIN